MYHNENQQINGRVKNLQFVFVTSIKISTLKQFLLIILLYTSVVICALLDRVGWGFGAFQERKFDFSFWSFLLVVKDAFGDLSNTLD